MKKFTLVLVAIVLSAWGVQSQTLPYSDNFESYTVGGYLAVQNPTWWTTWSNAPGTGEDALISSAFANSPSKSVLVDLTGGATDLLLKLGDKTSGKYELKWMMYVEAANCGYYNLQHFQSPGIEYAMEAYFRTSGSGELLAGSATAIPFTYPKDEWFEVKHLIDLDADNIKLYIAGVLVNEWPLSNESGTTGGTKQLGGVDFFAGAKSGTTEVPKYFFDDVSFQVMPTVLFEDDMESYPLDSYLAVQNPTWYTTWSNAPGTGEDALIKDAFSHSTSKSALVDKTGGATDLILKLGDKTTGKYELTWWDYIETAKCGYYNLQHFESPGTEYAMEVYFRASGSGELLAGSATAIPFTYPHDTWFEVKHVIDLDNDNIQLYVNGVMVHEWPFSYQAGSTTGTNQLGGVDFFAGEKSGTTEVPKLYFDDVYFAQLGAPSDPLIVVDPTSLSSFMDVSQTSTQQLTISNTGVADLEYSINVLYNVDSPDNASPVVNTVPSKHTVLSLTGCSAKPTNGSSRSTDATAILHYDGDNASAIGWGSPPITVTVAARFPNAITLPYAGMVLESVDVYINDLNATGNEMTLKIYGMGTSYEPGELLYSATFTPIGISWETIVLTTPLVINGQDIWVGYQFTQTDAGIYIPGTDAGPNDPNGDFISTGVGWSHLSNNPDLPFNWNIRANLTGDIMPQWLSVSPMNGTIAPDDIEVLDVTFNSTGLTYGVYEGTIRIVNNDPVNKQLDVPCMLAISVGLNELDKVAVMVYPNPAENTLNILSNDNILKVSVMSFNGKVVYTGNEKTIDVSKLSSGVYFIQTQTAKGISNIKFTKK
jgi:hypothetical protein